MNYTFLPETERKRLKMAYRVRALVVLFFVLSVANIIGIVALFPTYINSKILESAELDKIAVSSSKNSTSGASEIRAELNKNNVFLTTAEQVSNTPVFYSHIKDIISARGNVKIGSIAATGFTDKTISFAIQGLALNREDLLAFKSRLVSTLPGASVDLPISSLAKNKDIQFSINLTENI